MGLLGKDYYNNLLQEGATTPSIPVSTTPVVEQPIIQQPESQPFVAPKLTPQEQIKKFGGEIGSPEYLKTKANKSMLSRLPGEMASAVGIELPEDQVWDTMKTPEKIATTAGASIQALMKAIFGLPKTIVNIPIGIGNTIYQGWGKVTKGTPLVEQAPITNFLTGDVPSYFKTFDEAKAKGMGNLASSVMVFGRASGDFLIGKDLGIALKNSFAPRSIPLKPGEVVADTKPVQQILAKEQEKLSIKRGAGDTSEYHPLTNTDASKLAGVGANSGNTFFKFTPAVADGSKVELSVVRVNSGVSNFMNKIFNKQNPSGKFGPEKKVYSQIIDVGKKVAQKEGSLYRGTTMSEWENIKNGGFSGKPVSKTQNRSWLAEDIETAQGALSMRGGAGEVVIEFKPSSRGKGFKDNNSGYYRADNLGINDVAKVTDKAGNIIYEAPSSSLASTGIKPTIPSAPLKGFETKLVDDAQLKNLDAIGKVNNIDSGITEAVTKALTGKDIIGDLTQAEYVNVAKTISNLTKASQYAPEAIGFGNWLKNYLSPTRYWTRDVEQATGLPIHQAHMQMETGVRLAKVSEKTQLTELYSNPIIEKYASSKFTGERALVKEYMEGNTKAITDNPSLTPEVKAELIQSAGIFDIYLKKVAEDIGMEPKAFLDNYAPHVQERGGVYQLYKEKGNLPSGSEAFFREKRNGGLYTQIGDMWALADIYTRSAYKAKYMAPVLDSINEFKASLPGPIAERFASYIQEKLGYGDTLSKVMDSTAAVLNKKLGLNLPPDTARIFTNQALNTMYSSAMSQPATWLRNAFQFPTMGYAYWGSKFMGEAMRKSFTKEGMAEFTKSGFGTDLGVPFGEDLIKGATPMGKINSAYRDVTQSVLKPNQWVENKNRAPMYFQTKLIFEDTISKVNSGKLTWVQAEKELGLNTMNKIDANLIRQDLVQGNTDAAFQKLAQNAIDDTQFPYRKGESARFQYGMTGKLMTPFMQWPVEYIHTLGKWAGTGQWDKLGRWYASTTLITRTFSQQYNTDFSKSLGVNPMLNINLTPPPLAVMQNGLGLIYNALGDNEQAYEKNGEELFKTLKLAIPGGVEGGNILKAYKSFKQGPIGPDGTYNSPDSSGRPNYYNFRDLFWNALGMPTIQKTENQNLQKEMAADKFNYTQNKKEVLNLYQDGMSSINAGHPDVGQRSLDKANKLIEEGANNGLDLSPTDDDFNKFYIPATEQTYNYLPASLKAKFAPRVFSSPNK